MLPAADKDRSPFQSPSNATAAAVSSWRLGWVARRHFVEQERSWDAKEVLAQQQGGWQLGVAFVPMSPSLAVAERSRGCGLAERCLLCAEWGAMYLSARCVILHWKRFESSWGGRSHPASCCCLVSLPLVL